MLQAIYNSLGYVLWLLRWPCNRNVIACLVKKIGFGGNGVNYHKVQVALMFITVSLYKTVQSPFSARILRIARHTQIGHCR